MTENDPSAQQNKGVPQEPGEQPAQPETGTPSPGDSIGGEPRAEAPSPWSAQGAQSNPYEAPRHQTYEPPQSQPYQGQPYGTGQEGVLFGSAAGQTGPQQTHPHAPPAGGWADQQQGTATFAAPVGPPPQRPASSGTGKLVAGVAVLALLVGGAAGGLGGYLASNSAGDGGSSISSLDQPKPARQTGNAPAGTVESVAEKLSPSVVQLQVAGSSGAGEGSGFVLSNDGYILTNNHVVEVAANGGQIEAVFQNGKKAAAKIVGRDPSADIAVVKADGVSGLTPVELGRSDDLKVGQQVVAIGSPFELSGTVTSGIVSALHRPVTAGGQGDQNTVMDAVQTDAAINPGNSGGPLANMAGQVIGINSAIYSPRSGSGGGLPGQQSEGGNVGIGFAIPIDQARRTADDIIKTGKATQTYIGARVGPAQSGGAQIASVEPGSPAEQAGLKAGDVVTKIDDRTVDDSNALVAAIRAKAPGEKVKLTVGDSRTVEITLAGKPVEVN
ncbi:S1C family serine protease [Amycolatopsis anabasis]|uniref:S1C family serine protease n=1 Tax=Amycolatopsis anabasis TaxID=1840409 RepID=UPI00131E6D52|nr:trypsin-like peptidase domain-containing protein [Amycolatopsis anabasis]